jgi:glycosyltransferase involved in cell wall biosynthesis
MKVLNVTGDRRFGPGNPRYDLQKSAVEELHVVYWGRGAVSLPDARGFDVVTAQDPFWRGLVAFVAARRANSKLNVQVHADLSAQPLLKHILAQIALRHADSIRVVSEKIKKQVEHFRVKAPVHVLPVFVDLSRFQAVAREPHDGKVVLWVGRFEAEKNPLGAIEVFKEVLKTEPNARLVMLGSGTMESVLRARASGLSIQFPGWHDPLSYLREADVVLCTSWQESFGASIIEALAAGVPVVAPDVGVAGEAGAIVVPRNELAGTVVTILKEGKEGRLLLHMPTQEEWKQKWLETL